LHFACTNASFRCFEFLAELNWKAREAGRPLPINFNRLVNGRTPLRILIDAGAWEMIPIGKCAGMDLDQTDENGQTALHICAQGGSLAGVRVLCQCGANPNAEDTQAWTPLHYAAAKHEPQVCERLLSYGALPHILSKQGVSPFVLAVQHQKNDPNGETARVIRNHIELQIARVLLRSRIESHRLKTNRLAAG
jgi:hypothetical protein